MVTDSMHKVQTFSCDRSILLSARGLAATSVRKECSICLGCMLPWYFFRPFLFAFHFCWRTFLSTSSFCCRITVQNCLICVFSISSLLLRLILRDFLCLDVYFLLSSVCVAHFPRSYCCCFFDGFLFLRIVIFIFLVGMLYLHRWKVL